MSVANELNEVVLPQGVVGPLTRAAIFLVLCIRLEEDAYTAVRSFCADLAGLVRAVEFRDIEGGLTCVIGFGSDAWDKLFGSQRPAELRGNATIQQSFDLSLPSPVIRRAPRLNVKYSKPHCTNTSTRL